MKVDDDATFEATCANPPAAPAVYCPGSAVGVGPITTGSLFVANSRPNPFRSNVNFSFTLPSAGDVSVDIFSADGRLVQTVARGQMAAGQHSLSWKIDRDLPSGMYFYRVSAGSQSASGKITRVD